MDIKILRQTIREQRNALGPAGQSIAAQGLDTQLRAFSVMRDARHIALYLANDFGRWLFRQSRLPLIKHIPLSVTIYGGAFWTDFRGHPAQPGDAEVNIASKAYTEIGFGIGRIPPLNLKFTFTWQLSDYDTNDFNFGFGFGL